MKKHLKVGKKEITGQIQFLKENIAYKKAREVLRFYNKNLEGKTPKEKSKQFFVILEFVWKKYNYKQKLRHPWHKWENFRKDIILACHIIQPSRKNVSIQAEQYEKIVMEEVKYLFLFKMDLCSSYDDALTHAIQTTWKRIEKDSLCEHLWKSEKKFKDFIQKKFYFPSQKFEDYYLLAEYLAL